ncbi:restriction endonuclease [Bradyrhizobium diazoefficiens]
MGGRIIPFGELARSALIVDAIYQGDRKGSAADDPLPRLLAVSNQGGFRYRGSLDDPTLVILKTSLDDPDWADALDREAGTFIYFGDNKKPGRGLHETRRFGNELLRRFFERLHGGDAGRRSIPPIFVFSGTGEQRDVRFLGLAVPGGPDIDNFDDLVAVWRSSEGLRFQNYRARFTILDVAEVQRPWIDDLVQGRDPLERAPPAWRDWVVSGRCRPLRAVRSIEHRKRDEQLPAAFGDLAMVSAIHDFFRERPHDFERCAASLARMLIPDIVGVDVTRPSRDGGRDAIGRMKIGRGHSAVLVDFALEAKCYGLGNSVGVREMSRLISRLRHRQFGILVTTSFVDSQAYREIKEDQHPIVVVSAIDIVDILKSHGHGDVDDVRRWLVTEFRNA